MVESAQFPIVGVGASAGGVEALEGFFRGMPDQPGLAVVVVTHLNPERESILHEIIARYTSLKVQVATDGAEVCPNCVYVLPADAILGIQNYRLTIARPGASGRERKPIDIFFSALALDLGDYAAGAVLSGSDGDGTLGIKAIKERGGLTLAQTRNGSGPGHPSMPDSAIATGLVDLAIPVEAMGSKLVEFAHGLTLLDNIAEDATLQQDSRVLDAERSEIYTILRSQVGHDFAGYKVKTFMRRVQRRMQVVHLGTLQAYIARLQQDTTEANALFRDLLINVTNFFRDSEAFDNLATLVIPRLFEGRGADDAVRVWVPGCATGEEVYSIAILLREHMATLATLPRVQIFATDIDEHALAVARAGRYPAALLDSVSQERRQRFFVVDGGAFVLSKDVRDLCIFSPHSVIRDPPFSRMDLVSCRNLLIYFGPDIQGQVVPTFHYALRPGGYLFLGTSENISQYRDLFAPMDKRHRIFRSRDDTAPSYRLPMTMSGWPASPTATAPTPRRGVNGAISMRQFVQSQVLERFSPPHVVANREGDIVFFSNKTGRYLEAAPGIPTRQLLTMARRSMRLDLRTVFREAVEKNQMVVRSGIRVEGEDGRVQLVTLTVEPLIELSEEPLYLVLFADEGAPLSQEEAALRLSIVSDGAHTLLENELRDTRERLQALVEEYETALEELKSSNEELQSVNEELQSSNEELEASKEELQSVNEELHTVNAELHAKVEALDRANNDLQNLFDATNIATVFLDRRLTIRNFTPAVGKLFNILPGDRGRPITDLSGPLKLPDLVEDVTAVMENGKQIERQIHRQTDGAHFLVQFAPYRNLDQLVAGVVVTFVDVTNLTRAEAQLRMLVAQLQHRTRDMLGVIQAIARQTLGKGGSLEGFNERLGALGRVQGLISEARDEMVDLGGLIRLELEAHGASVDAESSQVIVAGPPTSLRLARVQAIALVVHELAANAVKYGALKGSMGSLSITWRVQSIGDGRSLIVDWVESGVKMATDGPTQSGFGMELIRRSLENAMRATTDLKFRSDGVSCRIEIPLEDDEGTHRPAVTS
ncbi:CheR family methyltransferase [Acidisphaera sp. L21]|uniref:CheR family methyltransferase n=1 Tax=Acidisphaera sp. L21 TaxID=1641851 RepID=UPI00131AF55F|nr:CheR family methyltransferase [Acidisphaera sp. L21]